MKEIVNKKASFEYFFEAEFEAGMMLTGTEIKSIRGNNVNLSDAWCWFDENGELWVRNLYIAEYAMGTSFNHDPRRNRKLLLRKTEIKKLQKKVKEKGFTIVPFKLFISPRGFAKLNIALASGKKTHDKRHAIQERDEKRDMARLKKIRL